MARKASPAQQGIENVCKVDLLLRYKAYALQFAAFNARLTSIFQPAIPSHLSIDKRLNHAIVSVQNGSYPVTSFIADRNSTETTNSRSRAKVMN